MPAQMKVPNCNNEVCEVRRGRPVVVEITFTAQRPITHIQGTVHVYYLKRWWKVNIGGQSHVCDHLISGRCPLTTGAQVTFRGQLNVPKFAKIGQKATVKVRGVDQNNHVVACVKTIGKVVG